MSMSPRSLAVVSIGILAALSLEARAQDAVGSFQRTLSIDGPVELDVQTGAGDITVRSGDAGQVRVVGHIRAWPRRGRSKSEAEEIVREIEANPPLDGVGNRVRIGSVVQHRENVSISYEIEVPTDTQVTSRTGSGRQQIRGVAGPVEATAGSGGITLTDIGGRVVARTGSGSIRADGISGAFDARAGSGSITLVQAAAGDVAVSAGSGDVDLTGVRGELRARTGSGRITARGEPVSRWDLETGSGSVRLALAPEAAFDLAAQTGSGRIETRHPVTVQGVVDKGRLGGQVREGGPLLRVRTGSGGIRID